MTDETAPVPALPEQPEQPEDARSIALRILDKARDLLAGEPARLIGYGAAAIIFLVSQFLASRGYVKFEGLTFEGSVALAVSAIAIVVAVIESIRRFVYSPQTYIEDLADEWLAGHQQAHVEERIREMMAAATAQDRTVVVPVAPAPVDNPERPN